MIKYYCVLVDNSHPICLDVSSDGTETYFTENLAWAEDEAMDIRRKNPDCTYEVKEVYYADPVPKVTLDELKFTDAGHKFVSQEFSRIYNDIKSRCAEFIPDAENKAHNVLLIASRIINLMFYSHFQMGFKFAENKIKKAEEKGTHD